MFKYRCGTFSTVRLRREHPGKEEGIVTREVCANIANIAAECAWPWEIKVKNCGDFFVYELPPSPDCPMSYCTGTTSNAITFDRLESTLKGTVSHYLSDTMKIEKTLFS